MSPILSSALLDALPHTRRYGNRLALDEKQHFRIVTARATSQPLFLRMLLYALKLGVDMSGMSVDEQLDLYLNKHDTTDGT